MLKTMRGPIRVARGPHFGGMCLMGGGSRDSEGAMFGQRGGLNSQGGGLIYTARALILVVSRTDERDVETVRGPPSYGEGASAYSRRVTLI